MGESTRKRHFLGKLDALCGCDQAPDVATVYVVMLRGEACLLPVVRAALGGVSKLLDEAVEEAASQESLSTFNVEWTRWPTGREQVRRVVQGPEGIERLMNERASDAAARGWLTRMVLFDGDGSVVDTRQIAQGWEAEARRIHEVAGKKELITVEDVKDPWQRPAVQIKILKLEPHDVEAAHAQLLRKMEGMVKSQQAMQASAGNLMLTFDGFAKDKREVWDIPECQAFIQKLTILAPWWLWLAHQTHAFIWIGGFLKHGPSRYLSDGEVFLDFDPKELELFISRSVNECVSLMADAGMVLEENKDLVQRVVGPLMRFVAHQSKQAAAISANELMVQDEQPASDMDPVRFRAKFEGLDADEQVAKAMARRSTPEALLQAIIDRSVTHYGFILDRSLQSLQVLGALKGASKELRNRFASNAVQVWERSGMPFVVVWGMVGAEGGMTIPCGSADEVTRAAIPQCVLRTIDADGKCGWAVCVDGPDGQLMEVMIAGLQPAVDEDKAG
jgi:hypothetical protein